jgi:ribosome-binding protein aMBF1 (putative translation factor)
MPVPTFWNNLAQNFELILDASERIDALWVYMSDSPEVIHWTVGGAADDQAIAHFRQLAVLAGRQIDPLSADAFSAWLNQIKATRPSWPERRDLLKDTEGETLYVAQGAIEDVCRASADLCRILALEAQVTEHRPRLDAEPPNELPAATEPKLPSIGEQIDKLREECGLSIEELAEKMDLHSTSVSRHIHDESVPSRINRMKYQRLFSKLLKRDVVIFKTQPKRS